MMIRFLTIVLASALLSGCPLDIGRCNYEFRSLTFRASLTGVVHDRPDSGTATLILSETAGGSTGRR